MSGTQITNRTLIRYSPRPLSDYRPPPGTSLYGPSTSAMLRTPGAWNLAYLSWDYDKCLDPDDHKFTVHVRRTCQMKLDGSGLDLAGTEPLNKLVESLLLLPAPRFVHLIEQHAILPSLPIYVAYGSTWLDTIKARSHLCQTYDDPPDNVVDFAAAKSLIDKIRSR